MKRFRQVISIAAMALVASCALRINHSDGDDSHSGGDSHPTTPITFSTGSLFPFQNNSNWWMYSESGGNTLRIAVTDTISDDGTLYYRVSFQEHRVDTTDDWFQQSSGNIMFGASLRGRYALFLPSKITAVRDTFTSQNQSVTFSYIDTYEIGAAHFPRAVLLEYPVPVIHGFDEIVLADSIGIIRLIDYDGRWTVEYSIDSCSIGGTIRRWR